MEDSYVLQLLKPKFKDFYLCFCGFAECEPLHSYGTGRKTQLYFALCNEGQRNLSGRRNEVSAERRGHLS